MKVSVCMITYNHEQFIAEAINGIISQKTNFTFELIIGDDCSTDKTREIIKTYQDKFPNKIRALLPGKNLGMMPNFVATLSACKGDYIALCEGDDYWTDPDKLQKQFDFMRANTTYSLCTHPVTTKFEESGLFEIFPILHPYRNNNYIITPEILIEHWGLHTCSFFFRNDIKFPDWFDKVKAGDLALALILSSKGPIYLLTDSMAIYRRHPNSVTAKISHMVPMYISDIKLLQDFNAFSKYKYKNTISKQINFYKHAIKIITSKTKIRAMFFAIKFLLLNRRFSLSDIKKINGQIGQRKVFYSS